MKVLRTAGTILGGRSPGQVVIQYTDKCNATCAQCGMRVSNSYRRTKLEPRRLEAVFESLASQGVESISFTGGEPLLFLDEIVPLSIAAQKAGIPFVRTGTNGFVFRGAERPGFSDRMKRLARTMADSGFNTFWISLDSADVDEHERNRGFKGIVRGIEKALPIFHDVGIYPSANLGINRLTGGYDPRLWPGDTDEFDEAAFHDGFVDAFERFYLFAESLGFTIVNACYPMSLCGDEQDMSAVYGATSDDGFIKFSAREKRLMFRALMDTVPRYRHLLRIFTPLSSLHALIAQCDGQESAYPCRGGIDYFFVDSADMRVFPCGYRGGEDLGSLDELDIGSLKSEPFCDMCDWECFRDPSVLLGPLVNVSRPWRSVRAMMEDRTFASLWLKDLSYYRACGFFNGRKAPDYGKMRRFKVEGRKMEMKRVTMGARG